MRISEIETDGEAALERTGDPTLKDTEVGPPIIPKEADSVASWIDGMVKGGARLATRGQHRSKTTLEARCAD